MALLEFRDVCKSYDDGPRSTVVLDRVSFELRHGDFGGLRGARRSGKSVLLEIAAGLRRVDSGQVLVCGRDLASLGRDRRIEFLRGRVGLACAEWRSQRRVPVIDYVATPLLSHGDVSRRRARLGARRTLERVGVTVYDDACTAELSLSESVRVELARALVAGPSLLLVDEPPALRSPSEGKALYELLRSLGHDPELAVLVASQDLDLVQRAERLFSLSRGRLRALSEPGAVVPFPDRRAADGGRAS
ncbi:MAG TPA: ATP-binding cassette domain-containing protein [Solirubrobacteraceae bacterium]|nr:ATP-binding cassette domain-containing protein [Solirubrobacteraceae bacterium]